MRHLFIVYLALFTFHSTTGLATIAWDFNGGPTDLSVPLPGDGIATAQVTPDAKLGEGWQDNWGLGSARGYWDLGSGGSIALQIPISTAAAGLLHTRVTVVQWMAQPLYEGTLSYSIHGGVPAGPPTTRVLEDTGLGQWVETQSFWTFSAIPEWELIRLTAPENGAIIDHISLENTLAVVPEPSGLVTGFLLSGLFFVSSMHRPRSARHPDWPVGRVPFPATGPALSRSER